MKMQIITYVKWLETLEKSIDFDWKVKGILIFLIVERSFARTLLLRGPVHYRRAWSRCEYHLTWSCLCNWRTVPVELVLSVNHVLKIRELWYDSSHGWCVHVINLSINFGVLPRVFALGHCVVLSSRYPLTIMTKYLEYARSNSVSIATSWKLEPIVC